MSPTREQGQGVICEALRMISSIDKSFSSLSLSLSLFLLSRASASMTLCLLLPASISALASRSRCSWARCDSRTRKATAASRARSANPTTKPKSRLTGGGICLGVRRASADTADGRARLATACLLVKYERRQLLLKKVRKAADRLLAQVRGLDCKDVVKPPE
mmetsp:Transcript_83480/g.244748  ORF Transcript_83480/g.244748 Transcript_83480/m.244748 type:complete len:162 (-) Transcript_83480:466-951(-)